MARWRCQVCGYIYDEKQGEPKTGTPAGTAFASLPPDWRCPVCQAGKESFVQEKEEGSTAAATTTTVSDVIVQELVDWGITLVFGIPGSSSLGLVEAIRRNPGLRYIVVRHEGNGAMAASAYNKLTGKIAVCLTIAGPGATNLATGLYDAKEDRASVLSLNGQVEKQYGGPGGFQEIDQDAFFRPITVYNNTIYHRDLAVEILTKALKHAVVDRGVAQVSVPNNVQKEPLGAHTCARESCLSSFRILPDPAEVQKAVGLINDAENPAIIAGWGAFDQSDAVIRLAERLKAPLVTTFRAKGMVPDAHPWLVGIHGSIGNPFAHDVVNQADLLITLGVGFSKQTALPTDRPMVQVDRDVLKLGISPRGVNLWGDCAGVIPLLIEKTKEKKKPDVLPRIAEMKRKWLAQMEREADPYAVPIRPPYIIRTLSEMIPEDGIISIDVGENGWWFGRNFQMKRQRFVMSGYLGTMGFGLPGAIAAKLAMPSRSVFCITGDGGFSMAMADFVTAVKYSLPMVVVIMNNHELGMIRVEQMMEQYPNFGTDLLNPDFTAFAEASGGSGIHVERPELLAPALREGMSLNRPVIIDVETDPRRFPL